MSSYRNLKSQIKNLTAELDHQKELNSHLTNMVELKASYFKDVEDELIKLKNMSWWERLWDF